MTANSASKTSKKTTRRTTKKKVATTPKSEGVSTTGASKGPAPANGDERATTPASDPQPSTNPTSAKHSAAAPTVKPKGKGAKPAPTSADSAPTTLHELSDAYVEHLKKVGKTESTVWGYGMELKTAMKELGEDAKLADLTPQQIADFYDCDRVTKTRTGRTKAMPGILKTRRVIRLALVWAVEQGWLAEAPLPGTGKEAE